MSDDQSTPTKPAAKSLVVGQRFGRLTIVGPYVERRRQCPSGMAIRILYPVHCDCGTEKLTAAEELIRGQSVSCGCAKAELCGRRHRTHGESSREHRTRLYSIWTSLRNRCNNPKAPRYCDYGGRGITVCHEWDNFLSFRAWALANGYRNDLTIERKDVNGHYEPANCCWIPGNEQSRNTRRARFLTAFGETKLMADWLRDPRCVVTLASLRERLDREWSVERALTEAPTRFPFRIGDDDAATICRMREEGVKVEEIASRFGVTTATIYRVCRNNI